MTTVLALQARRDRRQILVWVVVVAVLVVGSGNAVLAEVPTEQDRANLLRLALATPAVLSARGAPNGASAGSVVFFQLFSWLAVTVGLMNTFLAARHGRGDEEHGLRELLVSTRVRRTAPVVATLLLGSLVNLAVVVVTTLGLVAIGLPAVGSTVAGLALGLTGFAFLGVGLLASQVTSTSRAANGWAGAAVGLAYLLRAGGDALGTPDLERLRLHSTWLSWVSPIGWGEQTFALTADRWWPLALSLLLGAGTAGLALGLQSRRDLGRSLLPQRPGRATASPWLRTHLGLAWRLHRGSVVGWATGAAVLGLFAGALSGAASSAALDNPRIQQVLASLSPAGAPDVTALLIGVLLGLAQILAAAAGVQGVLRLRADESDGGAELTLATPLSRTSWLLHSGVVGAVSVLVVVLGVAATAALSLELAGDGRHAGVAVRQALAGLPAALVFVGLTALLVSAWPRVATGVAWGLFGLAVVIGLFGGLLQLPTAVLDASPFSHLPSVPVHDWTSQVVMLALTTVLTSVATVALRRRDLSP